jgi:IS30 family transposase
MNYKRRNWVGRYQIASLMKARHRITQIARLIVRQKSTISRELRRNTSSRGYRCEQASELAIERSEQSRDAHRATPCLKEQVRALWRLQ